MRLLFTYVSEGEVYLNGNEVSESLIKGLPDVDGSFVFELSDDFPKLTPCEVLGTFINDLTQMKFCSGFGLSNISEVKYDEATRSLVYIFDTSSG
jgi:hypothetical protein